MEGGGGGGGGGGWGGRPGRREGDPVSGGDRHLLIIGTAPPSSQSESTDMAQISNRMKHRKFREKSMLADSCK